MPRVVGRLAVVYHPVEELPRCEILHASKKHVVTQCVVGRSIRCLAQVDQVRGRMQLGGAAEAAWQCISKPNPGTQARAESHNFSFDAGPR